MIDSFRDVSNTSPFKADDTVANAGQVPAAQAKAGRKTGHATATDTLTTNPLNDTNTPDPTDIDPAGSQCVGADAPAGGPVLQRPRASFSPVELALLVTALLSKIDDAQSEAEKQGLKLSDTQRRESLDRANETVANAAKKLQKLRHKQKALGILSTVGKCSAALRLLP